MDTYTDEHWRELMKTIVDRIGMEQFIIIVMELVEISKTVKENGKMIKQLTSILKSDKFNQITSDDLFNTDAKDKANE